MASATSRPLVDLVRLLSVEQVDEDAFLGHSHDYGWGQVFGGQVLGQALFAATQTVTSRSDSPARLAHSLKGYFPRLGDPRHSINYRVERLRDGRSFSTRRVVAVQFALPIFECTCSFHTEEPGFEHQDAMPIVEGPDGLLDERTLWSTQLSELPDEVRALALAERPIELRPVDPVHILTPEKKGADHAMWMRSAGRLPDDPALHRAILAYASDFNFVATAMRPHGVTWTDPNMQVASLDHSMWFHRPFRIDDWLLHDVHSPSASGARGFARGSVFTREGVLVASTAQEGLMRRRPA